MRTYKARKDHGPCRTCLLEIKAGTIYDLFLARATPEEIKSCSTWSLGNGSHGIGAKKHHTCPYPDARKIYFRIQNALGLCWFGATRRELHPYRRVRDDTGRRPEKESS